MDVAVVVDFDGTATEKAVSLMLLERFASGPWRDLDKEYAAGLMTARDTITQQFEMIEATDDEIREFVQDHAKLRGGFSEFVSHQRGLGFPLAVASEVLDIYVNGGLYEDDFEFRRDRGREAPRPLPPPIQGMQ